MNCEEFELLLADELGGELGDADRAAFDGHLTSCATCRGENESLAGAVGRLQSLPAAPGMRVERLGDRLILTPSKAMSASSMTSARWTRGLLSYAAGVALAFLAGYFVHGVASPGATAVAPPRHVSTATSPGHDLQSAVAMQFSRNPGRSDLAKGLLAMYQSR